MIHHGLCSARPRPLHAAQVWPGPRGRLRPHLPLGVSAAGAAALPAPTPGAQRFLDALFLSRGEAGSRVQLLRAGGSRANLQPPPGRGAAILRARNWQLVRGECWRS